MLASGVGKWIIEAISEALVLVPELIRVDLSLSRNITMYRLVSLNLAVALAISFAGPAKADDFLGMEEGAPKIQEAGSLAFGPFGVLFVGDSKSATVFAVATGEKKEVKTKSSITVEKLGQQVASALGVAASEVEIKDLAVSPLSGSVYLSVSKTGSKPGPALLKIGADNKVKQISLKKIKFSKTTLANAPGEDEVDRRRRKLRSSSITDLAYVDGQLLVSGINTGNSSAVRALAFPFDKASQDASLQIFHAAHGREEGYAAIRTFVPFTIDGKPSLLAGFICTPLVKFPLSGVTKGNKIKGTTIAELGNRNKPYDMIVYKKDGKTFLLMANSARGVMKISTKDIEKNEGLTEPVRGGGKAGQEYETIGGWNGTVVQLDTLDETHAIVVVQAADESLTLKTVALP